MTYADDPFSLTKTEYGFDVFQAAKSRYASAAYKSFIGFPVAKIPYRKLVNAVGRVHGLKT